MRHSSVSERGHVLILALAGIGDLVLASPAIRCLQDFFGAERMTVAVVPRAHQLIPMLGIKAPTITLDLNRIRWPRPLLDKEAHQHVAGFLQTVHDLEIQLVVNLHELGSVRGLLSVMYLINRIGPLTSIGRGYRSTTWPYKRAVPEKELKGLHNTKRYLRVAELAGAQITVTHPDLDICAPPTEILSIPKPYICINPGGFTGFKRWPTSRFTEVGKALRDNYSSIVILGSEYEKSSSQFIADAIGTPAVSLAGKLDLPALAHILAGAEMLITNNSGPMHIAAALEVPTVAIFGNLPVDTLHPFLPDDRYRVLSSLDTALFNPIRPLLLPLSLRLISVGSVLSAVESLEAVSSK